jgi:hypothetical protein
MTTLCLTYKKYEKCGLKKYVKVVSIKKNKSSNEEFITEMH